MDKYSMGTAAEKLGISKETLYRWEKKGKIPAAKRLARNNRRVYTDEDLDKIREFKDEILDPAEMAEAGKWRRRCLTT